MNTTHTPGPWEIDTGKNGRSLFHKNGVSIAQIIINNHIHMNERRANARLIAAAPDLLEAIKEIKGLIEIMRSVSDNGAEWIRPFLFKMGMVTHDAISDAERTETNEL